jgi:hypothetical protein
MFACPEVGCTQTFSTERGLTIHRHICAFAEEGLGTSASEALKKLEEKRARKRQKTHQPEVLEEQDFPMFEEPILENTLIAESVSLFRPFSSCGFSNFALEF